MATTDPRQTAALAAARYPQRNPMYQGNMLIEALRPYGDDELLRSLRHLPVFSAEQRKWDTADRMGLINGLVLLVVPTERHYGFARNIEALMRQGYVGREPTRIEHVKVLNELHVNRDDIFGLLNSKAPTATTLTTSLLGMPGTGKTTIARRVEQLWPSAIFHEHCGHRQIPFIHAEMPHDGKSVKGMVGALISAIDAHVPGANYFDTYASSERTPVEKLIVIIARLLHQHTVGLLFVDEVQNIGNAAKGASTLMSLLVSLSNYLQLPIVFMGTSEARKLLGLKGRQIRRSVGFGMADWDRMSDTGALNEWDRFFPVLWRYQWVRHPVELTPAFSNLIKDLSQRIPDIAVKLFMAAQRRAILDGTEALTVPLFVRVFNEEMSLLAPMLAALRTSDYGELQEYGDMMPATLSSSGAGPQTPFLGPQVSGASIRPDNELFVPSLAQSLLAVGVEPERAHELALQVAALYPAATLLSGLKNALELMAPIKPVRSSPVARKQVGDPPDFPPGDLRNALRVDAEGTETVMDRLKDLGVLWDIQRVVA